MVNELHQDCASVQDEIIRLAFNESRFGRKRALKKHLRHCETCRENYQAYRLLAKGLSAMPAGRLPAPLWEKIKLVSVGRRSGLRSWQQITWRWIPVSVAVVLTCLVIYRLSNRPATYSYSEEEIDRARTQVQLALGIWGKAMSDTRSALEQQRPAHSVTRPVQNSLYLALKPFKTGE